MRGGMIFLAKGAAMRTAMFVSTNAIGHAIMNCLDQTDSHKAVGPNAIRDMIPDIDMAIRKVMMI